MALRDCGRQLVSVLVLGRQAVRFCSTAPIAFDKYHSLNVTRPAEFVVQVELNRPKTRNSLNTEMWRLVVHVCVDAGLQ